MDDKLKSVISAEVDKIFAGKKEEDMRKRTETALEESASTIEALATDLESERVKVTELETTLASVEESKKTLEDKKAEDVVELEKATKDLTDKVESLEKELEEKATELDSIKKDALAVNRMDELTTAGVIRDDKDTQMLKVREMSDEDFTAYKDELVSVRASILAELKETKETKETKEAAEAKKATEAKEEGSEEDGVKTPPAHIDPGTSVAAAMNMEIYPSDDLMAQYKALGEAMAEVITKDK